MEKERRKRENFSIGKAAKTGEEGRKGDRERVVVMVVERG